MLQEFGFVLRADVWHSTSVVQALPWGLRVVAYLVMRDTSHVLHQDVPLGRYQVRLFFELFWGILRGCGEGRGGPPGTVPLQNLSHFMKGKLEKC